MMMFSQLAKSGFIQRPFDHMCEGLEKSIYRANRDFRTKTMRGGGKIYHKDPLFPESLSSFMKFLRLATELSERETNHANITLDKTTLTVSKINPISVMSLFQSATTAMNIQVPGPEYLEICCKELTIPKLAIRAKQNVLDGIRFCLLGRLGTWKIQTLTHDNVKQMVENMGGIVFDNDRNGVLMNTHSHLPDCFVIVKDENDLNIRTEATEEPKDLKPKPRRRSSSSTRDGENEPSQHSIVAKQFAAVGFKFMKIDFLAEVYEKSILIDTEPDRTSKKYK